MSYEDESERMRLLREELNDEIDSDEDDEYDLWSDPDFINDLRDDR